MLVRWFQLTAALTAAVEAIQKTGNSCPLGWFSSGSYCVNNH
jgi:hypothetical protein